MSKTNDIRTVQSRISTLLDEIGEQVSEINAMSHEEIAHYITVPKDNDEWATIIGKQAELIAKYIERDTNNDQDKDFYRKMFIQERHKNELLTKALQSVVSALS